MLRRLSTATLALCLSAAVASTAQAQNATCGAAGASPSCSPVTLTTVSGTMVRIIYLEIAPAAIALTMPTGATFAVNDTATVANVASHAVTVRSNYAWALNVLAAWNNAKAVGDFFFTIDGGTNYSAMTGASQAVTTGGTGTSPVTIGYATLWRLATDAPGVYTQTLTFTLSAP